MKLITLTLITLTSLVSHTYAQNGIYETNSRIGCGLKVEAVNNILIVTYITNPQNGLQCKVNLTESYLCEDDKDICIKEDNPSQVISKISDEVIAIGVLKENNVTSKNYYKLTELSKEPTPSLFKENAQLITRRWDSINEVTCSEAVKAVAANRALATCKAYGYSKCILKDTVVYLNDGASHDDKITYCSAYSVYKGLNQ